MIRQRHQTFSVYQNLEELATEAQHVQGDILTARGYCPLPPASEVLAPQCAWGRTMPFARWQKHVTAAFAAVSGCTWKLSAYALGPHIYRRHAASAAPPSKTYVKRASPLPLSLCTVWGFHSCCEQFSRSHLLLLALRLYTSYLLFPD